jgi:RNA polymerase sigma factor (sigma-70 family)
MPTREERPTCGRKQPVDEDDRHDLELHRLVSGRERSAFDELYRRYGRSAYGVALRVTSQDLIAQEVVQDAFLALWRAPEAFDPARGAFRSFFLSLVHHRAVDAVRREERLRRRTERAANLEPATGEDPAEDVVEDAYLRVRRKEVRAALTTLPPAQQQVLEMAYFEGKTQKRIAEELGIPIGTVKTRTLAAMRKLREALREE